MKCKVCQKVTGVCALTEPLTTCRQAAHATFRCLALAAGSWREVSVGDVDIEAGNTWSQIIVGEVKVGEREEGGQQSEALGNAWVGGGLPPAPAPVD